MMSTRRALSVRTSRLTGAFSQTNSNRCPLIDLCNSQGAASNLDASSLGSAAALQALKRFTSGDAGASGNQAGGFQSKLVRP
jgi:hypothetical protein